MIEGEDFIAILEGSGCWHVVTPCDPSTLPAGSVVVMFEGTGTWLGPGIQPDGGPKIPIHIAACTGNGQFDDKPGRWSPPREHIPYMTAFGGYGAEGGFVFVPGLGAWVKGSMGGKVTYRYTVCYRKSC
jgi:hypothetical protein